MKIHSKYKDYYDSAMKFGADNSLHYIRHQTYHKENLPFHAFSEKYYKEDGSKQVFFVGFCGKVYKCEQTWNKIETRLYGTVISTNYKRVFEYELLNGDYNNIFVKLDCPVFFYASYDFQSSINSFNLASFNRIGWLNSNPKNWVNLIKNPCLADLDFFKVVSPFEAYQEISMFLGNELAKQEDPAPARDKDLIAAHGFDKFSFRKEGPPKRKIKK